MNDISKTLFVTDLDGTLLAPDGKLSAFTLDALDRLTENGVALAFATARSYLTAMKVVSGVGGEIPMALHNGAFIQKRDGEFLHKNLFGKADAALLRDILDSCGIPAIVYSLDGRNEYFSYIPEKITREEREFIDSRGKDPRDHPVSDIDALWSGETFYAACIGDEKKLRRASDMLYPHRNSFTVLFHPDYYTGYKWLEILPQKASKASAVTRLGELLHRDKIIVFGDAANDIDMFRAADESYAVSNAVAELKNIADGVIGSNAEDGVARYLLSRLGI